MIHQGKSVSRQSSFDCLARLAMDVFLWLVNSMPLLENHIAPGPSQRSASLLSSYLPTSERRWH